MIELTHTIQTKDGILVPKGVRLNFSNGIAKYQGHPIERNKVPLQVIKGAKGPFMHAACATLLNDNRGFQQAYKRQYKDWAHMVVYGDNIIVYIWDTRKVIDVISGLHEAANDKPIVRKIKNDKTGEVINQHLGTTKGWAKSLYNMIMWPQYARLDNGLPLITDNKDWQQIVDEFNAPINQKYSFEAYAGLEDIVGPRGVETHVLRYNSAFEQTLQKMKLDAPKAEPWLHIGIQPGAQACYGIWIWDTRHVIASGKLSREQVMQLLQLGAQMHSYALDNGMKLVGSGETAQLNKSMHK